MRESLVQIPVVSTIKKAHRYCGALSLCCRQGSELLVQIQTNTKIYNIVS